jgi:hypothetical protein
MRAPSLFKRASAEALGTFALVTGGCGAILVDHATGALGHGGVAASFGLVIMVMIAALGHLSGAHFNPAVTLAFAVTRHFSWRDCRGVLALALDLLGGTDYRSTPRGSPLPDAARRAFAERLILSSTWTGYPGRGKGEGLG